MLLMSYSPSYNNHRNERKSTDFHMTTHRYLLLLHALKRVGASNSILRMSVAQQTKLRENNLVLRELIYNLQILAIISMKPANQISSIPR